MLVSRSLVTTQKISAALGLQGANMGLKPPSMPLIHIEQLSKRFGVNAALQDVNLTLEAGSIHALLGQNGAGKSTLIKILSGLYTPTSGRISVAGHPLGSAEATANMAFIHQDLGLVDSMTIAENIALGTGFGRSGGFISWRQVRDDAAEALQTVASHLEPDRYVSELTRADKSLVAIARALASNASVIVLDEPTASLPAADSRRLFDVLEKLRSQGHGLLYVSHRLDEVFAISDTVTVLRDGRLIHSGPISQKSPRELVVDIVGHKPHSSKPGPRSENQGWKLNNDINPQATGPAQSTVTVLTGTARCAGFVGLGLMGAPMAANLLKAGWSVTAWNRSTAAIDDFVRLGGSRAGNVAALRNEPVIIFMLPDLSFIEEAASGLLDEWRLAPPQPGTLVVVMSSVSPVAVQSFGRAVAEASGGNAAVVDAPVSGGTEGAERGTLAIMTGASEESFARLLPVFEAMGTTVKRLGELGAGSLAKACNQLIVGTTTAALAEAAELAERSGMDVGALFEVLSGGLAGSRVLDFVGPRLAAKDYAPTGPAKFMHKDLSFVLESAAAVGAVVPMADAGVELYAELKDQGLGDLDLAAVRQAIANLSAAAGTATATAAAGGIDIFQETTP
jgi:2-hydroxy-3-oxopropionate reductase